MTSQVHTVFFDLGKTIVNGQKWVDGAVSLLEDLKALLAAFLTAGLIPPLHL